MKQDLKDLEFKMNGVHRGFYHGPTTLLHYAWFPVKLSDKKKIWLDEYVELRMHYRSIKSSGYTNTLLTLDQCLDFMNGNPVQPREKSEVINYEYCFCMVPLVLALVLIFI